MIFAGYTEKTETEGIDYGCLTYGFSDCNEGVRTADLPYTQKVFGGTYDEIIAFAEKEGSQARAAIVMTDGAGGENEFVLRLSKKLKCPVVGGGAARAFGKSGDGLFGGPVSSAAKQADICLLFGDTPVQSAMFNIHTHIVGECTLELDGPRILKKIDGEDAAQFLRAKKEELGFAEQDFEHLTFSSLAGVNAHLSEDGGIIKSGRDLDEKMILRYVTADEVQGRMEEFYNEKPNSLVFGCAGLKGITPDAFECRNTGLFLFGEICALDGVSEFGNLMLSRIEIG